MRFEDRAAALQKDGRWDGESDIFFEIGKATLGNLTSLFQPDTQKAVQRIAKAILDANRVYVSGYRSSFAFAHYLAYAGQIAMPKIQLLESPDGSHFDVLGQANEKDLIILFTFAPYASEGGRLLTVAKKRGCKIVAITDTMSSPAVPFANMGLFVPMTGPAVAATRWCLQHRLASLFWPNAPALEGLWWWTICAVSAIRCTRWKAISVHWRLLKISKTTHFLTPEGAQG